jgi:hypothetical protein
MNCHNYLVPNVMALVMYGEMHEVNMEMALTC